MLRIDKLQVSPLPPLSFSVSEGECFVVEGPSGSGKTRLLRAIADLDPAPGRVFLNGAERQEMPAPLWRQRVRYVSAEPRWWTPTAREAFAMLGTSPGGSKAPRDKPSEERRLRLLAALGLEKRMLDDPLAALSTGQRHRLALARALIDEPAVLLVDEPVAALDLQAAALVAEALRFQMLAGTSILVTAHEDNAVTRLAHARLQLAPLALPRGQVQPIPRSGTRDGPR